MMINQGLKMKKLKNPNCIMKVLLKKKLIKMLSTIVQREKNMIQLELLQEFMMIKMKSKIQMIMMKNLKKYMQILIPGFQAF